MGHSFEWLRLRVSHEVKWKCQLELQPSEDLTRAGWCASKLRQQCLEGGLRSHVIKLLECPWDRAVAFPRRAIQEREREGSGSVFYILITEVTFCHFYLTVFLRNESLRPAHTEGKQYSALHLKREFIDIFKNIMYPMIHILNMYYTF